MSINIALNIRVTLEKALISPFRQPFITHLLLFPTQMPLFTSQTRGTLPSLYCLSLFTAYQCMMLLSWNWNCTHQQSPVSFLPTQFYFEYHARIQFQTHRVGELKRGVSPTCQMGAFFEVPEFVGLNDDVGLVSDRSGWVLIWAISYWLCDSGKLFDQLEN